MEGSKQAAAWVPVPSPLRPSSMLVLGLKGLQARRRASSLGVGLLLVEGSSTQMVGVVGVVGVAVVAAGVVASFSHLPWAGLWTPLAAHSLPRRHRVGDGVAVSWDHPPSLISLVMTALVRSAGGVDEAVANVAVRLPRQPLVMPHLVASQALNQLRLAQMLVDLVGVLAVVAVVGGVVGQRLPSNHNSNHSNSTGCPGAARWVVVVR